MRTHETTDPRSPARGATGQPAMVYPTITPELIAAHVRLGHELRAEAIGRMARRVSQKLRGFLGAPRRSEATEDPLSLLAGGLRSPLSAIRTSAEILRDNPDIDDAKRKRFVDIVLAEEARLEALILRMLKASDVKRGSRVWQLRLDRLNLEPDGHSRCAS